MDVVCGVIQNSNLEFLACLRPDGKHLAGRWEFPGGKVEPDESPEAALIRELEEELGVIVEVGMPLRPVNWIYAERAIRLLPFYCKILTGEPQALEHERLLWCAAENFDSLSWADADLPVLSEILSERLTG